MAAISGQTTVTTAGTAVQLSATEFRINGPLIVKGLDGNTGATYVGNDGAGDVTASNGLIMLETFRIFGLIPRPTAT